MILQDAKRNKRGKPLSMARTRNADEADRYVYKKCAREENTRKSARDSIGADIIARLGKHTNLFEKVVWHGRVGNVALK